MGDHPRYTDPRGALDKDLFRLMVDLHRMLLRMAGRIPDEALAHARTLLGEYDLVRFADYAAGVSAVVGAPLTQDDVRLLRGVLQDFGWSPADLPPAPVSQVAPPAPAYRFGPASPDLLASIGPRIPGRLDLTGGPPADLADLVDGLTDLTDDIAADVVAEFAGAVGAWRAWRFGDGGTGSVARRVYVAEVESGVAAWDLVRDLQRGLVEESVDSPQVEVYWTGDALPPYQRKARASAALLWARRTGTVRRAPVYDLVDQTGRGSFDPDHPRLLDPADRELLLTRLGAGVAVATTDTRTIDVIEPARGQAVPLGHRTDGQWVWSNAIAYYLAEYGLAPHAELMAHLRAAQMPLSVVDGVALFRAELAVRPESQ